MKNLISTILFLFLLARMTSVYGAALKLNEALQSKKINCMIHGNGASTHYLESI